MVVQQNEDISFVMALVWKIKVPSKMQVFGWKFISNRIATKEKLAKTSIIVDDNDKVCPFCLLDIETLNHLMVQCVYAKLVW